MLISGIVLSKMIAMILSKFDLNLMSLFVNVDGNMFGIFVATRDISGQILRLVNKLYQNELVYFSHESAIWLRFA